MSQAQREREAISDRGSPARKHEEGLGLRFGLRLNEWLLVSPMLL
jgi:hypothetical protein